MDRVSAFQLKPKRGGFRCESSERGGEPSQSKEPRNHTETFHNLCICHLHDRVAGILNVGVSVPACARPTNRSPSSGCIWQWGLLSPEHRQPATQGELAKALGVRRSYVWRILRRLPFDAPMEMLEASATTPGHVLSMRQRHEQFRRQQDEQARREAEDWTAAWREEEARVRQVGCRPDQGFGNEGNAYLDDPEERAWRQEEVRRIMFPWLYKDKQ